MSLDFSSRVKNCSNPNVTVRSGNVAIDLTNPGNKPNQLRYGDRSAAFFAVGSRSARSADVVE